jgi:hypothetical protein
MLRARAYHPASTTTLQIRSDKTTRKKCMKKYIDDQPRRLDVGQNFKLSAFFAFI